MSELTVWYVGACLVMFTVGFVAGWMQRLVLQLIEHVV